MIGGSPNESNHDLDAGPGPSAGPELEPAGPGDSAAPMEVFARCLDSAGGGCWRITTISGSVYEVDLSAQTIARRNAVRGPGK